MAKYAQGTTTTIATSQEEIRKLVVRFGATKFGTFEDEHGQTVMFQTSDIPYKITLPINKQLSSAEQKRRWRVLVAIVKAKMVAVEEEVSTFEREFIGNVVLLGGQTVADTYSKSLPEVASGGGLQQLALPGGNP